MLSPGDRFEGYTVDGVVGRGGTSIVYRARENRPEGRTVALKVLTASAQPGDTARLDREFTLARTLVHPHIAAVFDHGPGWLAMEFCAGGPVTNLPTRTARLTALTQIAGALDHLHGHGMVHCDVKPANMLLRADFTAHGAALADFGIVADVALDLPATDGLCALDDGLEAAITPVLARACGDPGA